MFLCYFFGLWVHALFSSLPFRYQYQSNWLLGKICPRNDLLYHCLANTKCSARWQRHRRQIDYVTEFKYVVYEVYYVYDINKVLSSVCTHCVCHHLSAMWSWKGVSGMSNGIDFMCSMTQYHRWIFVSWAQVTSLFGISWKVIYQLNSWYWFAQWWAGDIKARDRDEAETLASPAEMRQRR